MGEFAPMSNHLQLRINSDVAEIARLHAEFEKFVAPLGLSGKMIFQVNLALDEIITNIIQHGYDQNGYDQDDNPPIAVNIALEDEIMKIEIIDAARPFNPLSAPAPDLDAPIADRPVGGLGIHLVKSMMDEVSYQRKDQYNHLVLIKRITPWTEKESP
jgi:serine/threonine-protein kinase RsbW